MTSRQTHSPRANDTTLEAVLLARLGLSTSASAQEVEAAHDAIVEFLASAPPDLRSWTRAQVDSADEAYALLSDPTVDRSARIETPSEPTARAAAPAPAPVDSAASRGSAGSLPAPQAHRGLRRLAIGAAAVVGIVAIAIIVFNFNGGTGVPGVNGSPAPEAAASSGVDPAQVAPLMEKIQQNPKDVASLQALADLYYQGGDYATSRTFLQKIIALDAKNLVALLALGATEYNLGDATAAEKQWRAVLSLDDNNVDAHYYLGFMYLTQEPPDMANVRLEWDKVVAIAPDSDIAKSVSQHLASLTSSPAPSGTTGAPAASPGGAASPPLASPSPGASPASVN